ncbi:MAG: hypothetical protein H6672_05485 [Anaerolineaceae bacterium]|nr:hypothetical protein [Anaerolineaceae bacterium]
MRRIHMDYPFLEPDEHAIETYTVQYVQWLNDEWIGRGEWLQAVVTNRRLMLIPPEDGLRGKVDSVRYAEINRVWNLCLGKRDGVLLRLKNRQHLYLYVDWSQGNRLAHHLQERMTQPTRPRILPRLRFT